ncbi:hypothetical protein SAY86_029421 [Trapa natans]|uniref:Uncharacterized protein n=1 Tax=Trapa natans TaxID=22666 RepID=A0AAN7MGZ3_TRANT|nr:hypothetical protein SAY86_029421 [Trapa natans]
MGREPSLISKPPLDKLIPELLDRAVKALDVCNAVMPGIVLVRQCQKLAEIAAVSLEQRPLGEGQARRARKALAGLLSLLGIDDTPARWRRWKRLGQQGPGIGPITSPIPGSAELVRGQADSGHVGQSGGTTWDGSLGTRHARIHHHEHCDGFRDVGPRRHGHTLPGEDRTGNPFPGSEAIGMGPVDDGAPREDRGGVEEEGEERGFPSWAAGRDSEDGEAGAVPAGVLGQLPVPDASGEARQGGGSGSGVDGDLPEDGGFPPHCP